MVIGLSGHLGNVGSNHPHRSAKDAQMSATTAPDQIPAFNTLDPAFIADPYPTFHKLRAAAPVWQSPFGFWIVTRYEDAALVLRDRRFGKDFVGNATRRYWPGIVNEPAFASHSKMMLVLDPPDHTRLRGLVIKAFTARRVEAMRPRIAALVDALLDRVAGQGEMDVIADFAHRLPVIVICDMLGIPEEDREWFFVRSRLNARMFDPVPLSREEIDAANANTEETNAYFDDLFERRRRDPRDDLATQLVQAEEAGDRLSQEELHANVSLLFAAGHETTANLIGNGLLALHRNPDQWQALRDEPALIRGAVEELLRYDSSVQMTTREVHEDVELSGVTLPKGVMVACLLGAANRDPAMFPEPDRLDVRRQKVTPLSFGGGIHFCLGAQLARIETQEAFAGLLRRFPDMILPERDSPTWRRSFTLRGLTKLPAQWNER
jgi:cytochrome P450